MGRLHLPTKTNNNLLIRDILPPVPGLRVLHHTHDIHPVDYLAEDDVLSVEEGGGDSGDEELGAVAVGARVLCWLSIPTHPPL